MVKPILNTLFLFFILIIQFACNIDKTPIEGVTKPSRLLLIAPPNHLQGSLEATNDYKSLKRVLTISGILMDEIESNKISKDLLSSYDMLVVPQLTARSLDIKQIETIVEAVDQGGKLYFDGSSPMANQLGIKLSDQQLKVWRVRDSQFPKDTLFWVVPAQVNTIDTLGTGFKSLCKDNQTKKIISVKGKKGKGQFIFSSALFDPNTEKGYSRFPYLIECFERELNVYSVANKAGAELFLDLGDHDGITWDEIAKQWKNKKVKRLFASAWNYDRDDYDYANLISACHKNGIAVYCWLETPMVSYNFWMKYPKWREKTATLADAKIDWRYLMNMADENCRKQCFLELDSFINAHEWDGINLAELYFDPVGGLDNPSNLTPMNDWVRHDFEQKKGFDPYLIFDKKNARYWEKGKDSWQIFVQYRKDLSLKLKDIFLEHLAEYKKSKPDFELMLTAIDVSLTPETADNIGEDSNNTKDLYHKYGFALQIEDPANCWGSNPERYSKMGEEYRKYVKDKDKLLFDCNVVLSHPEGFGGFPAQTPNGEEIRQITYNMAKWNSRPVFYSEASLIANDFANISKTLAIPYHIDTQNPRRWKINCDKTITIKAIKQTIGVKLNDKDWYAQNGSEVIIPKGKHILEFIANETEPYKLTRISGEILSAEFTNAGCTLKYSESGTACFTTFNKKAKSITVDGKTINCSIYELDGECTLRLPTGTHVAVVNF